MRDDTSATVRGPGLDVAGESGGVVEAAVRGGKGLVRRPVGSVGEVPVMLVRRSLAGQLFGSSRRCGVVCDA